MAGGIMNRAAIAAELIPGLNAVFGLDYRSYPEEWRPVFQVENSVKAYERDVLVTGFGAAQIKAEGATTATDSGSEAWMAVYNHITVALKFIITREALEDNLYMQMGAKYAKALARSFIQTKEIQGASILNNGFSSSYAIGDGQSLLSTAHPTVSGLSLSNQLATPADLSETAIEDLVILINTMKDDRGIPVVLNPKLLIIPPQLVFTAERILKSRNRPGTADNDVNAINNMGIFSADAHQMRRLTSTTNWFIKTDALDGMKHFSRIEMQKKLWDDEDTDNFVYKCRERYSFGVTDWRGVFGSGS